MASSFSISQTVRQNAKTYPKEVAYITNKGKEVTYTKFAERVAKAGTGLAAAGLRKGSRCAIVSLNSAIYLEAYFATPWAGGWIVPINIRLKAPDIIEVLNDCQAEFVLLDGAFTPLAEQIQKGVSSVVAIVFVGEGTSAPTGIDHTWEGLIAANDAGPAAEVGKDDIYSLCYTGGTTGKSKGVMLTHTNILANAYGVLSELGFKPKMRYLHCAPMFHAADGASTFAATMAGSTHCFVPKFTPGGTLEALSKFKITHTLMVPTMFAMCCAVPDAKTKYDFSSVQRFLYGASPMPSKVLISSMELFPTAAFTQGYGMTECSPVNTFLAGEEHLDPKNPRLRSVGKPPAHVELKIVDANDNEVGANIVGELCARGPHVMKGYFNLPEKTALALKGGWMHTGDGAMMDEDGFIYIKDRIKDMIVSGGENVYSAEVEDILSKCEGVSMVAVIGIPDDILVEKVTAIIVPKEGANLTEDKVIEFVKTTALAGYKRPRKVVIRNSPLPLSGAGKILKTELRKPFWEGHERNDIYAHDSKVKDGAH
eukprot:g6244.t1